MEREEEQEEEQERQVPAEVARKERPWSDLSAVTRGFDAVQQQTTVMSLRAAAEGSIDVGPTLSMASVLWDCAGGGVFVTRNFLRTVVG